jgi:predicted glycosyltransferase
MKILFDLQHPAHLHFFRNAIERLIEEGHTVKITGRDKDILVELARRYHMEVEFFGTARKGIINLSYELVYRQQRLYRIIREFRPDLMMAIAGTFISTLGWLLRIPVYVFYDTEHAAVSNLLAYPFAACVYVPRCYRKKLHVRHVRYDGYHELAYLHPSYFTPDPAILSEAGLSVGDTYTIVRFVGWGAAHDIGKKGFTDENKIKAIKEFECMGKVFISSEGNLPAELRPYRIPIGVEKIHHLMAFASLVFGESATMASEAAVLGVPAVFLDPVGRGYTDEQERKYEIVFNFRTGQQLDAIKKGAELLGAANREYWKGIGQRIVRENEDVTKMIYDVAMTRPFTKCRHSGKKNKTKDGRRREGDVC